MPSLGKEHDFRTGKEGVCVVLTPGFEPGESLLLEQSDTFEEFFEKAYGRTIALSGLRHLVNLCHSAHGTIQSYGHCGGTLHSLEKKGEILAICSRCSLRIDYRQGVNHFETQSALLHLMKKWANPGQTYANFLYCGAHENQEIKELGTVSVLRDKSLCQTGLRIRSVSASADEDFTDLGFILQEGQDTRKSCTSPLQLRWDHFLSLKHEALMREFHDHFFMVQNGPKGY